MRLALIGVGMIGGSAALAWRASGLITHVTGYDRDPSALTRARTLGVIDVAAANVANAVAEADLVLLAVPVGAMRECFEQMAPTLPTYAIVTDVGSTKADVIAAARGALNANSSFSFRRFVPAHPIAGRETPGVDAADATLFRDRYLICTPTTDTHPEALTAVERLWAAAGARIERMDAAQHDRVFAAVSHLPHLLAFALVARLAGSRDGNSKLAFAGGGFRDFTRIAASSPVMWRDIALANRQALGEELQGYRNTLDRLQAALDAGDAAALEAMFDLASRTRRRFAGVFDGE